MNMITLKKTLAALAVAAFAQTAFAQSETALNTHFADATSAIRKAAEGASGIALFGRVRDVNANSSWEDIKGRALPDWPTIGFPNGGAYILPSVCVKGDNLYVIGKSVDEVCRAYDQDGNCTWKERVELVQPRNYTVSRCTNEQWYQENVDTEYGSTKQWFKRCVAYEPVSMRHPVDFMVDVKTAPSRLNPDETVDIHSGKLLFQKAYTIGACK